MPAPRPFLSVLLVGVVSACHKQPVAPQPLTRTQLLLEKKWQLRDAITSFPGAADLNTYQLTRPCSRDDFWQFSAPATWLTDEGPTKCGAIYPQTTTGTWQLSANDTHLTLTDQNFTDTYTILRLTRDSLKLSIPIPQVANPDGLYTATYVVIK